LALAGGRRRRASGQRFLAAFVVDALIHDLGQTSAARFPFPLGRKVDRAGNKFSV
jgi:hypothetical protein